MRILYVHSTLVPPPTDVHLDRFYLLSDRLEGDVLQPIWYQTPEEVEAHFGPGSYPVYTAGKFRYHWFLSPARGVGDRMATFLFHLRKGLELNRERPFDCIVAYSHQTTGVAGGILKLLTGKPLIIEIASSPQFAYIMERPEPGLRERIMKLYSDVCLHLSALTANRAHFLYPKQLDHYRLLRNVPNSVFHEFVPVSFIDRESPDTAGTAEPYVLMVGAPWFLKGADILIRAFAEVAPEFPGVRLKILGYYPGQDGLKELAGGSEQIEILRARPNPETLEIIKRATVMVTPSRCEGFGRVILEAMSAAVPVIASDVGGIPTLVHNGENGYLIPVGDHHALAMRLRQLLSDAGLRRRMGDSGYLRAHRDLDERSYVREFADMVEAAVPAAHKPS